MVEGRFVGRSMGTHGTAGMCRSATFRVPRPPARIAVYNFPFHAPTLSLQTLNQALCSADAREGTKPRSADLSDVKIHLVSDQRIC